MKKFKLITLVIFVVCGFSHVQAQNPFNKKEVKANQTTYTVNDNDKPNYKSVAVANKENVLAKNGKVNTSRLSNINIQGDKKLNDIFLDVFGKEKFRELLPEKRILLIFYTNKAGKVVETAYLIDKNTAITPQELEELEKQLKKYVSFSFTVEVEDKHNQFYTIIRPVFFNKISSEK